MTALTPMPDPLPSSDALALLHQAREASLNAYSPYSHYRVGAALLTTEGKVVYGCNVENASYGLTCCAERNALFTAVGQGYHHFKAIALYAEKCLPDSTAERAYFTPCGACRQVLAEFSPDGSLTVILENPEFPETPNQVTIGTLLPSTFEIPRDALL
jgi:cytidine deaminase